MKSSSKIDSAKSETDAPPDDRVRISGAGVSAGIVSGHALLITHRFPTAERTALDDSEVDAELDRFQEALEASYRQIRELKERIITKVGEDRASILDTHLLLLRDRTFIEGVTERIREHRIGAQAAIADVVEKHCAALAEVPDSYIRERTADFRDVAARTIRVLQGRQPVDLGHLDAPAIVVAHDLSPSEAAGMDRRNVLAVVTAIGSRTAHTAIMTRALGIPAVIGVGRSIDQIKDGDELVVDGTRGEVIITPDDSDRRILKRRLREQKEWLERIQAEAALPPETLDGYHVRLAANVELPDEVTDLKRTYGVGIGLFRTEYLFVRGAALSSEEEQYRAYRRVAREILPKSVILRTLDIGGDKFLSQLDMPTELNPFLGMRAIRFSLSRRDLFVTQLRAILRASAHGKVRLMFPMIATLDELQQAMAVLDEVKADLARENVPHNPYLDVGIMIEVPSAALLADQLAPHVDFFSLGTNDLVQYSLAVDRSNPDIRQLYQPSHPSIIRLMKQVVDAAYDHGIWVSICGEMAGEPLLVPLVLGLGIHELSMSPVALPQVKRLIRGLRMHEAEALVSNAMRCGTADDVLELCRTFLTDSCPDLLPPD